MWYVRIPVPHDGESGLKTTEPCEFLTWDTDFFGWRIARVIGHRLSRPKAEAILEWCRVNGIECLYLLADVGHAETVRLAEDYDFRLVDIRVTLERRITDGEVSLSQDTSLPLAARVRSAHQEDIPALQAIAQTSYTESRFYYDPRFPVTSCEALYGTWIKRSCEGYADAVLVAEVNDRPVGYVSCHLVKDGLNGQIGLLGVNSRAQGRGIGKALVAHCLRWFARRGVEAVKVATQGRNVKAQRLYQSQGFLTFSVHLWYHKWFGDSAL